MTFETFVSSTKDLCDKIAAKMISNPGGYWTDGDGAFTTGSTPPGRCLKYFNVGTGETYYVGLVAGNYGRNTNQNTEAVIVFFSTGWDLVNHIPSGTVKRTSIPIQTSITQSLTNATGQAWMWYDDNGFTLLWKTDPTARTDEATLFALERDTAKEYSDGYTNFFLFTESVGASAMPRYYGAGSHTHDCYWGGTPDSWTLPAGWATLKDKFSKYIHPFGTELPPVCTDCTDSWNFTEGKDWTSLMWYNPISARKSPGNAKVYLGFGWAFNDTDLSFRNFIKKIKTFFAVKAATGLADGDIINVVVGVETWQYIYKSVVSPDGGQLDAAIRYA